MSQIVNTLPALCLIAVIIWSYYAYVYELCILAIKSRLKQGIYLVIYHILFFSFVIMYFLNMFHKKWQVPSQYYFTSEFYEHLITLRSEDLEYKLLVAFCKRRQIRVYMRTSSGGIRFCNGCRLIKPDRAHHCSTCRSCVRKMDHHCPWINNCVGFTNHKYFLVLVLYGCMYCTYYFVTCLEYCIKFATNLDEMRQITIVVSALMSLALGIALWSLLVYHIKLVIHNETTIEAVHPPTFASSVLVSYNKGCKENVREVCSLNPFLWILPVNTEKGNGVEFELIATYI